MQIFAMLSKDDHQNNQQWVLFLHDNVHDILTQDFGHVEGVCKNNS